MPRKPIDLPVYDIVAHEKSAAAPALLSAIVCLAFDRRAEPRRIAAFKDTLLSCSELVGAVEAAGSYDLMLEIRLVDIEAYHRWIERFAEPMSRLTTSYEASLVTQHFFRNDAEAVIWVPQGAGMRSIKIAAIDKICAERDYMRIHSGDEDWLVHATMHSFVDRLDKRGFVQLHRSALVRVGFIERMIHTPPHWTARLSDGTEVRVARSHVTRTLDYLRSRSLVPHGVSSKNETLVEQELAAGERSKQILS